METMWNKCKKRDRILKNALIFFFVLLISIFILSDIKLDDKENSKILAKNSFWKYNQKGIKTAEISILNNQYSTIKLLKIAPKYFYGHIMYSKNMGKTSMSIRNMTKCYKSTIGINANYFDEDYYPLGHLKISGKIINNYIAEPLIYSGIICLKMEK